VTQSSLCHHGYATTDEARIYTIPDGLRYAILFTHPEGLVPSPESIERLYKTGNLESFKVCPLFSLQAEFLHEMTYYPLALILWNMADRYDIARRFIFHAIFEVRTAFAVECLCEHKRPRIKTITDDNGRELSYENWS